MTCHDKGIQPFTSAFKAQLVPGGLIDLGISDKKDPITLRTFIRRTFEVPDFNDFIQEDQDRYLKMVKYATGITDESAGNFSKIYDEYFETDLDMATIQLETGATEAEIKAAFTIQVDGANNGVLLQQLQNPPVKIRRDHWEESFPDTMRRILAWRNTKK